MAGEKSPTEFWISLMTLVLASIVVVVAAVFIVTTTIKIGKINPDFIDPAKPGNLVQLRDEAAAVREARDRNRRILIDYFQPLGIEPPLALMEPGAGETLPRFHDAIDPADVRTGARAQQPLQVYLDHWQRTFQEWQRNLRENHNITIPTFGRWADGAEGLTFKALLDTLDQILRETIARGQTDGAQARAAWGEYSTARQGTAAREDRQLDQIVNPQTGLTVQLGQVLRRLATEPGDRWNRVVTLDRQERAVRQNLQDVARRVEEERDALTAERDELADKIRDEQHRRALAQERQEPDGLILRVDADLEIVYVDLTKADRVFPGMRFRVFRVEPGAVRVMKGEIQIFDIGETSSRGYVTHRDPGTPALAEGDRIFNVQYERGSPFTVTFAGRFTRGYSAEDYAAALTNFGDRYEERLTDAVDLVVVGDDFQNDPTYLRARQLGVRTITDRSFAEYLGLPR